MKFLGFEWPPKQKVNTGKIYQHDIDVECDDCIARFVDGFNSFRERNAEYGHIWNTDKYIVRLTIERIKRNDQRR